MKKHNMVKRFVTLAVASLFAGALVLRGAVEDRINKEFQVKPGSKLVVAVDRGSVDVKSADTDRVAIEVKRKLDKVSEAQAREIFRDHEVTLAQDGDEVRIRAQFKTKHHTGKYSQLQVRYQITVPKKFDVDLKTAG